MAPPRAREVLAERFQGYLVEAVRRNGIGDFTGAEDVLRDALAATDDLSRGERQPWRARLLITRAYTRFELEGFAAALADLEEARQLAASLGQFGPAPAPDPLGDVPPGTGAIVSGGGAEGASAARATRLLALANIQEGNLHTRSTRWREAVACATAAEELVEAWVARRAADAGRLDLGSGGGDAPSAHGGRAAGGRGVGAAAGAQHAAGQDLVADILTTEERCALLLNRGFAQLTLLEIDAARTDLERLLELIATEPHEVLRFKAIHNLGCLAYVEGDLALALSLMQQADDLPVEVERDRVHVDQAHVLIEAGLVDEAHDLLEQARSGAIRAGHLIEQGAIELDLARCAILRDDLDAADVHAQAAIETFRRCEATDRVLRAELVGAQVSLALATAPEPSTQRSEQPFGAEDDPATPTQDGRERHTQERSERHTRKVHERHPTEVERVARYAMTRADDVALLGEAQRLLAEAYLARGATSAAEAVLRGLHLLDEPESTGPDGGRSARTLPLAVEIHETYLWARASLLRGDTDDVTRRCQVASRSLARHQAHAQSLEVRSALAFHSSRLATLDITHAVRSGQPIAVFDSVERWRASSARLTPVGPAEDAELADLVRRLRHAKQLLSTGDPVPPELTSDIADLERAIVRRDRALPAVAVAPTSSAAPVSVEVACAAAAAAGVSLVSLVVALDEVYAVVLSGEGALLCSVGPLAPIEAAAATVARDGGAAALAPPQMAPILDAALRQSAAALDALVVAPLAGAWAGGGGVVIVPSQALATVPWGGLPSLAGVPLTIARSVTSWVAGRGDSPERSGAATMRVKPAAVTGRVRVAALGGPGLRHTVDELTGIGSAWRHADASGGGGRAAAPAGAPLGGGRCHLEVATTATSAEVVEALRSATVVHLAAHGHHEEQNPLFSSLRLSDGPVFAHELPRPIAAEHVVLSACDVGRSRMRVGDEPLGLTAALLALGARSVVAAVAPVPDEAAAAAMVAYHARLAAGQDAASALAATIVDVPAAGAFCLFGANWSRAR